MRTPALKLASTTLLLFLSACQKSDPAEQVAAKASLSGPQDADLNVSSSGYRKNHFKGPDYIPGSSPIPDGTTLYNVTYQPNVTVISKQDTLRHLTGIERDGTYLFDASSPQIAHLKPDTLVLLSGLALGTVVNQQKLGSGYILKIAPAKITDVIKEGQLEGTYKIDFNKLQTASPAEGVPEYDIDFQGFNYHVKFTPASDRIRVQATIKFAGNQGTLAYEGVGYLRNFASTIAMQIKDGQITRLDFTNANLDGQVQLKWFAVANGAMKPGSMARITSWPEALLKNAVLSNAAYHVPILLGAVPFDLRISLGFSFIPDFTAKNTVLEGSKLIRYAGSGGFSLRDGTTKPFGTMTVQGNATAQDNRVIAVGPVGFTAATEAPRLDLTLGWPPIAAKAAGYLNFITSYGIVTNGMVNPRPCQTNIMAFSVTAGAAYTSSNTFATWQGLAPGATPFVSLWQKTLKSPGAEGTLCPG